MDVTVFIIGFILGGIAVYIPLALSRRREKKYMDGIFERINVYFENTANKVIQEGSAGLAARNSEKLEEFFVRFRDKLESFERRAQENLVLESENFTKFDTNIKSFIDAGRQISQDARVLSAVMKADNKTSGRWGELVLERVLEASGLRRGYEFDIQKGTQEGRPDATVNLPEGRKVFIDSKTSFASWDNYINSSSEEDMVKYKKEFFDSTKSHISGLAKRSYSNDADSPDYVLMFIPIEGCYTMMFCEDCALWDYAWKNGIMPVSPSTLMASLKIIKAFHKVDKQNKNVQEMTKICVSIHDKFAQLLLELLKVRDNLSISINKLDGKSGIINQLEKLEGLGADCEKQIPEIK